MDSGLLVRAEDVSKSFSGVSALKNVHFDLRPGEIHALLGEKRRGQIYVDEDRFRGVYPRCGGTVYQRQAYRQSNAAFRPAARHRNHTSGIESLPPFERRGKHLPEPRNIRLRHNGQEKAERLVMEQNRAAKNWTVIEKPELREVGFGIFEGGPDWMMYTALAKDLGLTVLMTQNREMP
jgi:hypothetical protein